MVSYRDAVGPKVVDEFCHGFRENLVKRIASNIFRKLSCRRYTIWVKVLKVF